MAHRSNLVAGVLRAGLLVALLVGCSSKDDKSPGSGGQATGGSGGAAGSSGGVGGATGGSAGLPPCPSFATLEESCGSSLTAASVKKVNALLVVDKSNSMRDLPVGFTQNKWASLTEALNAVLTGTESLMAYGLELFPEKSVSRTCDSADCCAMPGAGTVDVPIPAAVSTIVDELGGTEPSGGTPTAEALRSALAYFKSGGGSQLQGDKVVLLATDGGPNCNGDASLPVCAVDECTYNLDQKPTGCNLTDPQPTNCCDPKSGGQLIGCLDTTEAVSAISELAGQGIKTAVLGIPGSEQYAAVLDEMARAGELPSQSGGHDYYAANADAGVEGLKNVIKEITTKLIDQCDLPLNDSPPEPEKVTVALDCNLLIRASGEAGTGDWTLDTSTTPPTVKLLGDVCTQVSTEGARRLDVLFGCVGPIN